MDGNDPFGNVGNVQRELWDDVGVGAATRVYASGWQELWRQVAGTALGAKLVAPVDGELLEVIGG